MPLGPWSLGRGRGIGLGTDHALRSKRSGGYFLPNVLGLYLPPTHFPTPKPPPDHQLLPYPNPLGLYFPRQPMSPTTTTTTYHREDNQEMQLFTVLFPLAARVSSQLHRCTFFPCVMWRPPWCGSSSPPPNISAYAPRRVAQGQRMEMSPFSGFRVSIFSDSEYLTTGRF